MLAALTQFLAKPWVATELIITRDPALWHVLTPLVKHLQTLLLACLGTHLGRHVACVASWLVASPLLRERQPEVE